MWEVVWLVFSLCLDFVLASSVKYGLFTGVYLLLCYYNQAHYQCMMLQAIPCLGTRARRQGSQDERTGLTTVATAYLH